MMRFGTVAFALWSAWLAGFGNPSPARAEQAIEPDTVRLSIVGTNDFHGALEARHAKVVGGRVVGGMGTIAAYLKAVRDDNPSGFILLDGGDLYQGTLLSAASEGRAVIDFYNDLGYTAVVIGNHDFDFGPIGYRSTPETPDEDPLGVLKDRLSQARFPFLAANIVDRQTGKLPDWPNFKPFVLVERQGIRIGIVGLTSVDTPLTTHPANVRGLEFRPLLVSLQRVLSELRRSKASLIILVIHAGVEIDEGSGQVHGPVVALLRSLEPGAVDLVVGGHTHLPFANRIEGVPVLQSWPSGIAFTRAELVVNRKTGRPIPERTTVFDSTFYFHTDRDGRPVKFLGKTIQPLRSYARKLKVFKRSIAHLQRIRLGHAQQDFLNQTGLDSPVGNLVTDAMRASDPCIQIAMYNSGGLRTSIPKGIVTFGRIYEVVPFDNSLVKVTLTGTQIREILEHGLSTSYGVMEISGLRVIIDQGAESGKRCLAIETEDGQTIQDDLLYVVGTNEFVLNGGDGYFTFARGRDVEHTHTLIRELVARYIQQQGIVTTQMGGRYRPATKSSAGGKSL